jgi:diadenosine tetraphosphate (Ap4A) HIT family hydrolase
MKEFGIQSHIMSLTGIAIAIGVLVDAAIVMTENVIRHCEQAEAAKAARPAGGRADSVSQPRSVSNLWHAECAEIAEGGALPRSRPPLVVAGDDRRRIRTTRKMNATGCLICDRIAAIKAGTNPYLVAELDKGYVVLGDFQFFRGYTLFLGKRHVSELHELPLEEKERFLVEMSLVAESVYRCFQPRKLNYECLGNAEPHLHWHLFPRHADDPSPGTSSWKVDQALRYSEAHRLSAAELQVMKSQLLVELKRRDGLSIRKSESA